jgi:hypothetical protein
MKVVFLDFDGVLNSAASFVMEGRKREGMGRTQFMALGMSPVNETLCSVCTSNFQLVLDHFPELKIVISSTWRELFDLEWLKSKLQSYGVDSSRVIDKTPVCYGGERGREIGMWLAEHQEITKYAIIDDNHIGNGYEEEGKVIKTTWDTGMTLEHVYKTIKVLGGKKNLNIPR